MRMTWVTGIPELITVLEAGIICSWNVFGTAAWKRKSDSVEPYEELAVNVTITKLGLSTGRSKEKSTLSPFLSYAVTFWSSKENVNWVNQIIILGPAKQFSLSGDVGAVPRNPSIKKLELGGMAALIWVVGELSKLAKLLLTKLLLVEPIGVVMGGGAEESVVDPLKSNPPNKSSRSKFEADGAVEALELVTIGAGPLSKLSNPPNRLSKEF